MVLLIFIGYPCDRKEISKFEDKPCCLQNLTDSKVDTSSLCTFRICAMEQKYAFSFVAITTESVIVSSFIFISRGSLLMTARR